MSLSNRNLLLDFDGVLVDSNLIKSKAFYQIGERKLGKRAASELLKYHLDHPGESRFTKLRWFAERHKRQLHGVQLEELENEFKIIVLDGLRKAQRVERLVEALQKSGIQASILSAAPTEELVGLIDYFGWSSVFESRIYGSPTSKHVHLERLRSQISLPDSILVGDSVTDFEVAEHFGVHFAFIDGWTDWRPSHEVSQHFIGTWPTLDHFLDQLKD